MSKTLQTMKSLTYGTELEYEGIGREEAAKVVQSIVGGAIEYTGGTLAEWTVIAPDERRWKIVRDGSLSGARSAEIVSPILRWDDMDELQEIVRALRKAGAKALSTTSQHVHIGAASFNTAQLGNLAKIFYKQEELILKAAGTWQHRLEHYTKPTDKDFIERLERAKPRTNHELNRAWFGNLDLNPAHYHSNRYRALNLNNIWRTGTVEFRFFNGTTHAGEVKAHIHFCLAMAAKAINAKSASSKNPRRYNEESAKYDMRVFLLNLGLKGEEFKNTRMHLLKRMPGSAAWKNGRALA